ncbi:MAG: hypothetical protein RML94_12315, partial [Bacteroidia bacterium]|nr:hypothetical protein [Bacteroidia bacterium]
MPTRSACYGLRYRFGAALRFALLTHPPHASRKPYFDVLLHVMSILGFISCLNKVKSKLFILFCTYFQIFTKLNAILTHIKLCFLKNVSSTLAICMT